MQLIDLLEQYHVDNSEKLREEMSIDFDDEMNKEFQYELFSRIEMDYLDMQGEIMRDATQKYENELETEKMFDSMMDLTKETDAFFFTDYEKDGEKFRVFNYRLVSYTEFLKPYAREMRGITFLLDEVNGHRIVSRPFEKFFNWGENPLTIGLNLAEATMYEEKADGSLIATYVTSNFRVYLKSKQAFFSEQAQMAEAFLMLPINSQLQERVRYFATTGRTVLMELCSPSNRIVLEYPTTSLKVHGIRDNVTGEYILKSSLSPRDPLFSAWVDQKVVQGLPDSFIASTELLEGIEGYVVHGPWGRFKLKTEWYKNLHHLKDSVSSAGKLLEAILYERIDDVKAMFITDVFTINRILEVEAKVIPIFNHIVKTTAEFYEDNKSLDRKSFAIKGQVEIKDFFHLAMNLYLGKEADYKQYCLKYKKELFNVNSEDTTEIEE
jgi:T4 RnlA family RNA ligase